MNRPGVQYWVPSGSVQRQPPTHSPPVSPPASRTSTSDYYEVCGVSLPLLKSTLPPTPLQAPPPPPPPSPLQFTSGGRASDGGDVSDSKDSVQRQRERQQRADEIAHLEATLAQERADCAQILDSLQASLQRERLLRTSAEQGRQSAQDEGKQLRAAIRAFLAHPPSDDNPESWRTTAPISLYEEARRLLMQCKKTFAELKALQSRAADPAGLELLCRYDIPLLGEIPPAWPPGTPKSIDHEELGRSLAGGSVNRGARPTSCAPEEAAAGTAQAPVEGTPAGLEISALTTLSRGTPCSASSATQEHSVLPIACKAPQSSCEKCDPHPVNASSNDAGTADVGGEMLSTDGRRRPRSLLLSPPSPSPPPNTGDAVQVWKGPMQELTEPTAHATAMARRLDAGDYARLIESEAEGMIRDADCHHRHVAEAIAALAASRGLRTASEVAALCRRCGLQYIDAEFLPVSETLGLDSGGRCHGEDPRRSTSFAVQWRLRDAVVPPDRKSELLTSVGIDPRSLRCGRLGDAGVVAALAALAEAAGAVASMFSSTTSEDEDNGLYTVWLCVRGWWTRVTVDAYLPCVLEPNRPVMLYGCSSNTTYDLWGPICEKALAKVLCGYHSLSSLTADAAIGYFTGGPVECWDWWHRRSGAALEEMKATLDSSTRGVGVVLLSTFAAAALRERSHRSRTAAGAHAMYQRLGLRPGTAYRVLAVADNAEGEPMLLLRNWTQQHEQQLDGQECDVFDLDSAGGDDGRNVSPRRERSDSSVASKGRLAKPPLQSRTAASHDDSCVWLSYAKEVLPHFDDCHVCFDCRRYHDLRIPIVFAGSRPAIPAQVVRVRVQEGSVRLTQGVTRPPTRLWIGLHQPASCAAPDGARSAASLWGLKVTLVGQEEAPVPFGRSAGRVHPARWSYLLSESFLGEPKELPAVWMYLELDATADSVPDLVTNFSDENAAAGCTTIDFFVVPQMERVVRTDRAYADEGQDGLGSLGFGAPSRQDRRGGEEPQRSYQSENAAPCADQGGCASDVESVPWTQRGIHHPASAAANLPGSTTTAVVAVLAEHRDSVVVDVVDAPEELRAAVYHNVLDHIDFSDCTPAGTCQLSHASQQSQSSAAPIPRQTRCQLNGRCMPTFSW
ncbi:hypothetical protein LSCM1_00080 [Leishmania martiniquensis]|uniref:Calpain catalytic domain-containing protein n=1 Tax=Leishmania martiniquensis TaxID=1580590 RepID=A0A836GBC5_9TRYP|nr:hypothetical protein LSCM1_00080 [Leishmania martiniquensis]